MNARMAGRDAERVEAHGRLHARLAEHLEAGQSIPCAGPGRDAWTDDEPEVQAVAARACIHCPALDACRRYVTKYPEPTGVWAGRTVADRERRRPKEKK